MLAGGQGGGGGAALVIDGQRWTGPQWGGEWATGVEGQATTAAGEIWIEDEGGSR